jgi:hypothetical protein
VSQVIEHSKYKLVNTHESECFKLRHAYGDQPSKYGQFMFDAIDNSLLTKKQRELAHTIRTTPEYRTIVKDHCIQKWGTLLPYEDLRGLFERLCPNEEIPSDHPPIIASID